MSSEIPIIGEARLKTAEKYLDAMLSRFDQSLQLQSVALQDMLRLDPEVQAEQITLAVRAVEVAIHTQTAAVAFGLTAIAAALNVSVPPPITESEADGTGGATH